MIANTIFTDTSIKDNTKIYKCQFDLDKTTILCYIMLFFYNLSRLSFGSVEQIQKKARIKYPVFLLAKVAGSAALNKGGKRRQVMKPSFDSVSAMWRELSPQAQQALVDSDNRPAIEKFLCSLAQLLVLIGTVGTIRPTEFVVRNKFKKGGSVKFYGFWGEFEEYFLGKVEKLAEVAETTLRYQDLVKNSLDRPIIEALGGEAKAETSAAEICGLLEKQPNGEDGPLLTNGYANIFYVRDVNGVLRAVGVGWSDGGWDVIARSVVGPREWGAGDRVFSRNS